MGLNGSLKVVYPRATLLDFANSTSDRIKRGYATYHLNIIKVGLYFMVDILKRGVNDSRYSTSDLL